MNKNKILVITGPTAAGKSALAIDLALRLDGEIISCDSMQVYRGMDIGTAKPSKSDMELVPHHMIDVADPHCDYSCAEYTEAAREAAGEIIGRGHLPILCGGTGLYIDSFLGANVYCPPVPKGIRESLEGLSADELYGRLSECDPDSARTIHKNNIKRVIRALEIYIGTGITKSEWDRRSKEAPALFSSVTAVLSYEDRGTLYSRTDARVDLMIKEGLEEEVRSLDLPREKPAAQAIGYKELYSYFDGCCSYAEAVENIKRATRNYVKRQETWFRRYTDAHRFFADRLEYKDIVNNIVEITENS